MSCATTLYFLEDATDAVVALVEFPARAHAAEPMQ
jgi:hypothetical protein